jgi:hypothetical protein
MRTRLLRFLSLQEVPLEHFRLDQDERRLMEAGTVCSRPLREMMAAEAIAFCLQRRGLVRAVVLHEQGVPTFVRVEVTPTGQVALAKG